MTDHPRVLFVSPLAFNHFTGGGVTFSNLFRGWPQDRLFTVHQDALPLSRDVCVSYFALGPEEMPLAGPLEALRRRVARVPGDATAEPVPAASTATTPTQSAPGSTAKRATLAAVQALFGNGGLPVSPRITPRLAAWIEAAKPDVIYTILGSIEMMELVEQIRLRFGLPVVVHLMDDWRMDRERGGLLSPWRRRRLRRLFDQSMRHARGHLAICDAMAEAYGREYGVPFEGVQNVIDDAAWLARARGDVTPGRPARLLYAGSLYPNVQLSSLIDIAEAVARLRAGGTEVTLDVMCPDFMIAPFRDRLAAHDGTQIVPQLSRERYFEAICAADLLLLPAGFDAAAVRLLRYSMPTKVPEYLVSGVPILLYGPEEIAQVAYAEREGWGLVVKRRDASELEAAIARAISDMVLRRDLVARARQVAAARHEAEAVRQAFRAALTRAAGCGAAREHCEAR